MKTLLFIIILAFGAYNENTLAMTRKDYTTARGVVIYSGTCTMYKLTLVDGNKKKYTPVKKAFGKVVISKSGAKTNLNFFFDGKLLGNWSDINSYVDTEQGGEGFSMYNGWSAHRFTAERMFQIYYSDRGGADLGYEYEISNYKVN